LDTPPARAALPAGQSDSHSDSNNQVSTTPAGGGAGPSSIGARKYLRDMAGRVGGGQQLEYATKQLLDANPHDEADIAEAYQQMLERIA
jgi:hypothetical protein